MRKRRLPSANGWPAAAALAALLAAPRLGAQLIEQGAPVVNQHPGDSIPLDLTFKDESGTPIALRELLGKPVVLTLIYLRCPSVCSPLLHGLASAVDRVDLEPGIDYRLLSVSFDARETPDLALKGQTRLLARLKEKKPSPDAWRFLTGDERSIAALATAVGFQFTRDGEDFIHPVTVVLVSPGGKITQYLTPTRTIDEIKVLPDELEMAIMDASEGRVGSVIQKVTRLCYRYDPATQRYVFQINRIILVATLAFVGGFGIFLLVRGRKRPGRPAGDGGTPAAGESGRGDR